MKFFSFVVATVLAQKVMAVTCDQFLKHEQNEYAFQIIDAPKVKNTSYTYLPFPNSNKVLAYKTMNHVEGGYGVSSKDNGKTLLIDVYNQTFYVEYDSSGVCVNAGMANKNLFLYDVKACESAGNLIKKYASFSDEDFPSMVTKIPSSVLGNVKKIAISDSNKKNRVAKTNPMDLLFSCGAMESAPDFQALKSNAAPKPAPSSSVNQ